MKSLKKILLINWLYYRKQVFELGEVNFLTGKTGAGKSTIIDALQIVFLGELNARNFNKAANESAHRTLDGYLRADLNPASPNSRRGREFSSYIACEFYDDVKHSFFVTGIVFDCHSDNSREYRFFSYTGAIPEDCFVVGKLPMTISELRGYLRSSSAVRSLFFDTNQGEYRKELLAKWNLHTEQVCSMLKKAVSFRPIVDIQKFITENVCDLPERPDTNEMQRNIQEYKHQERMAQLQEEKLERLKEISRQYQTLQSAIERYQVQKFLILWAERQELEDSIQRKEKEQEGLQQRASSLRQKQETLGMSITDKSQRCNELQTARNNSDVFQEKTRLEHRQGQLQKEHDELSRELEKCAGELRVDAQRMSKLCQRVQGLPGEQVPSSLFEDAKAAKKAYISFQNFGLADFSTPDSDFLQAQQTAADLQNHLREAEIHAAHQERELSEAIRQRRSVLRQLENNGKDYPKDLMEFRQALSEGLRLRMKKTVSVDILADLLEITDGQEHWRGAVEGYLNAQKFYLLIPPEAYPSAVLIYDTIKRRSRVQLSFGLIDVEKLRTYEDLTPRHGSLAEKVTTENALARSYVDYLLGRVICCNHVKELRRHRTAITAEGMLYQGYVTRPLRKKAMEDTFIGRKAIKLRLERTKGELKALEAQRTAAADIHTQLQESSQSVFLISTQFIQRELPRHRVEYQRMTEIPGELHRIEEEKSKLNLFWLAEIEEDIHRLRADIERLEQEKDACILECGGVNNDLYRVEFTELPELHQRYSAKDAEIHEQFADCFVEKSGLPRYEQELQRLKKPTVIVKNFGDSLERTRRERSQAEYALLEKRQAYVQVYQRSFRVDALDNEEFSAEEKLLEESDLPRYREKIREARESALEQFQNDFLAKLKASIDQVKSQVGRLNQALGRSQFGTERYRFLVERNPDESEYYDMIMDPDLMEGQVGLFAQAFQGKYGELIERLFSSIAASDDTQMNARAQSELTKNIEKYTDYRTYLRFDLETTDERGNRQLLSQTLRSKSGGETQTPFYIAVLASFAQLYQVHSPSTTTNNTVRLVLFDEAFNKMDSDRIVESIQLLRKMHLQAIICTPPDKVPDIAPLADRTYMVCKDNDNMFVLPYGKEVRT